MKKLLVVLVVAFAVTVVAAGAAFAAGVAGTKHDLSVTPGNIGNGETCAYCHTPHGSDALQIAPLWSHEKTATAAYTVYASPTMNATMPAALTSVSLACMSCHDGTVGLGNIAYGTDSPLTLTAAMGAVTANFGTNLSNDHPVSIDVNPAVPDANIAAPATIITAGLPLFGTPAEIVECGTCHNVHNNTIIPFLRISNANSAMCKTCHLNH